MNHRNASYERTGRRAAGRRRSRRGVAVLLVFLLLAMTMGLSYAAMRGQGVAANIQRNSQRRASARQLALTGATMALGKMQASGWAGADSSFSGQFSSSETFFVSFATGDPRLTASSPDYADYPFRVTITSTGTAVDPDNAQCKSTYTVRVIAKFVPRALESQPANWSTLTSYLVYEWDTRTCSVNPPCQLAGAMRVQGSMYLANDLPWSNSVRDQYFGDLNLRRVAGLSDWRPVTTRVRFDYGWQPSGLVTLLNNKLAVPTTDYSSWVASYWSAATSAPSYKLYSGGKSYSATVIESTQQATTFRADPKLNPAGLLYRAGKVDVYNDVSIEGTLMLDRVNNADLHVWGKRIKFNAVNLPPIHGSTQPVQLPALMIGDDLRVHNDADVAVKGLAACYDEFEVVGDDQNDIICAMEGGLIAGSVYIRPRSDWVQNGSWWDARLNEFKLQKGQPGGIAYFPDWLASVRGLSSLPKIAVKPATAATTYHWPSLQNPIYAVGDGDSGLRWDVIDWVEIP